MQRVDAAPARCERKIIGLDGQAGGPGDEGDDAEDHEGAEAEGETEPGAPGQRRRKRRLPLAQNVLGPPDEYDFPHVRDEAWGSVYLFTGHAQVGKERFLECLRATYRAVVPQTSPCFGGQKNAVVARELGRGRPRRAHLHLAADFRDAAGNPARHRWKQVRAHLARVHGIHVRLGVRPEPLVRSIVQSHCSVSW